MAMSYGHFYVAQVAFGAKDAQTVNALLEADRARHQIAKRTALYREIAARVAR